MRARLACVPAGVFPLGPAAPAREKFTFSDGNTWTVEYANVQMNPKLPASALDLPKGARRVKMQ